MEMMFQYASKFNADISKWDVSKVTNMGGMFHGAKSFSKTLCGAWQKSKASAKSGMFSGSSGKMCTTTATKVFAPKSKGELEAAIRECLKQSTHCSKGPHGPIGSWDVSAVTDMSHLFTPGNTLIPGADKFNGDISKWDVSSVTDMGYMFAEALSFNGDISKWDVSKVKQMGMIFYGAKSFSKTLCGAWQKSTAGKSNMFSGSSGKIMCTTTTTTPKGA